MEGIEGIDGMEGMDGMGPFSAFPPFGTWELRIFAVVVGGVAAAAWPRENE